MSIEALVCVHTMPEQGVTLNPHDRLVLYALADVADVDGIMACSQEHIIRWSGLSPENITTCLARLERRGVLIHVPDYNPYEGWAERRGAGATKPYRFGAEVMP